MNRKIIQLVGAAALAAAQMGCSESVLPTEIAGTIANSGPQMLSALAPTEKELVIEFNQPMGNEAENPNNFLIRSLTNGTELPVVSATFTDPSRRRVRLETLPQSGDRFEVKWVGSLPSDPLTGGEQSGGVTPTPSPDTNLVAPVVQFAGIGTDVGQEGSTVDDLDGDGLADVAELQGWMVTVTLLDGSTSTREVRSDPTLADTDGDGVGDRAEFDAKTDPRNGDTDGDGLFDAEERRYLSIATNQDTDGDGLFDGAEVLARRTSPLDPDTDGDGVGDQVEFQFGRNPRLADIPVPVVSISGLDFDLDVRHVDTVNQSNQATTDTLRGFQLVNSSSTETGRTDASIEESLFGVSGTFGVEATISKEPSVTVSAEVGFSSQSSQGTSHTTSLLEGSSLSEQFSEQVRQSQTSTNSVGRTTMIERAIIRGSVRIHNPGIDAINVQNLRLIVRSRDPRDRRRFTAIAELAPQVNPLQLTIRPGETSGEMLFTGNTDDGTFSVRTVEGLIRQPLGVRVEVSRLDHQVRIDARQDDDASNDRLLDANFLAQEIGNRTANITIDYGNGRVDNHRVALFDPDQVSEGITPSRRLIDMLRNDLGLQIGTAVVDVDSDRDGEVDAQVEALTRIGDVERAMADDPTTPNLDERFAFWTLIGGLGENRRLTALIPFSEIEMKPRDQVALVFVSDRDKDGLFAREEALLGSSDDNPDSDGDGLSDFAEAIVGSVVMVGTNTRREYSSPVNRDSDGDGIPDPAEVDCFMNPLEFDTDTDGLPDALEVFGGSPIPLPNRPYVGAGSQLTFVNGQEQFVSGVDHPPLLTDKREEPIISPALPSNSQAVPCRFDNGTVVIDNGAYATDPRNSDTDRDGLLDGEEVLEIGSNPNQQDAEAFRDTDQDGVTDRDEMEGFRTTINGQPSFVTSSPFRADTDDDGLPDLVEYALKSNPDSIDTDGDGLEDGVELKFSDLCLPDTVTDVRVNSRVRGTACGAGGFRLQPLLDTCAAAAGCRGFDPEAFPKGRKRADGNAARGLNLNEANSDGDLIPDADEIGGYTLQVTDARGVTTERTVFPSPRHFDDDGDSLGDALEVFFDGPVSDPERRDTDGDGVPDDFEFEALFQGGTPGPNQLGRSPTIFDAVVEVSLLRWNIGDHCDGGDEHGEFEWQFNLVDAAEQEQTLFAHGDGVDTGNRGRLFADNKEVPVASTQFSNTARRVLMGPQTIIGFSGFIVEDDVAPNRNETWELVRTNAGCKISLADIQAAPNGIVECNLNDRARSNPVVNDACMNDDEIVVRVRRE